MSDTDISSILLTESQIVTISKVYHLVEPEPNIIACIFNGNLVGMQANFTIMHCNNSLVAKISQNG